MEYNCRLIYFSIKVNINKEIRMHRKIDTRDYGVLGNLKYMLKTMWKYDRLLYAYLVLSTLFSVILSVLGVYLPSITINGLEEQWSIGKLVISISLITLLIAACNLLKSWQDSNFSVAQDISRQRFINRINKVTMQCNYSDLENPKLQVKIDQVTDLVYTGAAKVGINGMQNGLRSLLITVVGVLSFIAILHRLNIGITLFLFFTTWICSWLKRNMVVYEYNHRQDWAPIDKKIDYINSKLTRFEFAKDIRIFNCTFWLMDKLKNLIIKRSVWIKHILINRFKRNIVESLIRLVRDGGTITYIIWLVIQDKVSASEFILYIGSVTQLTNFLSNGFDTLTNIKSASLDMNIIRNFLELDNDLISENEKQKLPELLNSPLSIKFEHVSFRYSNSSDYIIKDINFYIREGEKIALVGSNGAGKTTLIKLLCGFYKPTEGRIYIDDIPIDEIKRNDLFSMFSVVFQENMILPFSVVQNIAMTTKDKIDYNKAEYCRNCAGLAERLPNMELPLVKEAQENGIELSGGEAQKLFLARALYKDSPILLLDEPTAALDPIAESEMYMKYNDFSKNKTSIFISHRLASTSFCDRILYIKDGAITEEGSHQQLLNNGGDYAKMYQVQSKYYQENEVNS